MMHWFRSRIRSGGTLGAVCARVADDRFVRPYSSRRSRATAAGRHRSALQSPPPRRPASQPPAGQQHQPASDDYCSICASIAVLATWMPALPPVLVSPEPIRRVWPPLVVLAKPTDANLVFISSARAAGRLKPHRHWAEAGALGHDGQLTSAWHAPQQCRGRERCR